MDLVNGYNKLEYFSIWYWINDFTFDFTKGGYMDAKKSKLEEQFTEDALKNPYKESNLFTGISIFVNGLTNPSAGELKRIMMSHGGTKTNDISGIYVIICIRTVY